MSSKIVLTLNFILHDAPTFSTQQAHIRCPIMITMMMMMMMIMPFWHLPWF